MTLQARDDLPPAPRMPNLGEAFDRPSQSAGVWSLRRTGPDHSPRPPLRPARRGYARGCSHPRRPASTWQLARSRLGSRCGPRGLSGSWAARSWLSRSLLSMAELSWPSSAATLLTPNPNPPADTMSTPRLRGAPASRRKHWRCRSTAHGVRTATEQTPGLESNNRQSLLMLQLRVGEQRSILMLASRHRMGV